MSGFVEALKAFDDFYSLNGVETDAISDAEHALGLHFSEEYKDYLTKCGLASANGHEYTGIVASKRLNVVDVTNDARSKNSELPETLYVVEELQIDGITIWQDQDGKVYESVGMSVPEAIFESLQEYVEDEA